MMSFSMEIHQLFRCVLIKDHYYHFTQTVVILMPRGLGLVLVSAYLMPFLIVDKLVGLAKIRNWLDIVAIWVIV